MTTKSTAPKVKPTMCKYCGKPVSRTASVKAAHGARCAFIKATLGDNVAQAAHLMRYTDNAITNNANYVKLATVSASIRSNGITTVSRFVNAFGTDKNAKPPLHVSLTPIYTTRRVRYIHKVWLNKSAQTMLATNQVHKINAKITAQAQAAVNAASGAKVK
jgi:hypothetical protein